MNSFCHGWTCSYLVSLFTFIGAAGAVHVLVPGDVNQSLVYNNKQLNGAALILCDICSMIELSLDLLIFSTHSVVETAVTIFPKITKDHHPSSLQSMGENPNKLNSVAPAPCPHVLLLKASLAHVSMRCGWMYGIPSDTQCILFPHCVLFFQDLQATLHTYSPNKEVSVRNCSTLRHIFA